MVKNAAIEREAEVNQIGDRCLDPAEANGMVAPYSNRHLGAKVANVTSHLMRMRRPK